MLLLSLLHITMSFFSGSSLLSRFVTVLVLIHKFSSALTITSSPSEISLNRPATITWDRGPLLSSDSPFVELVLFRHEGATYTRDAVLECRST